MNDRRGWLGLLMVVPLFLTGCGAAVDTASGHAASTTTSAAAGPVVFAATPSKSALMICGKEIGGAVATIMALRTPAPARATWVQHKYTCTYQLPVGPLVLSVQESRDIPAARQYFKTLGGHLGRVTTLTGPAALGLSGYETSTGAVVFLKDNRTLEVDATKLPRALGPQSLSRTAVAYQIAAAVMECWTGS